MPVEGDETEDCAALRPGEDFGADSLVMYHQIHNFDTQTSNPIVNQGLKEARELLLEAPTNPDGPGPVIDSDPWTRPTGREWNTVKDLLRRHEYIPAFKFLLIWGQKPALPMPMGAEVTKLVLAAHAADDCMNNQIIGLDARWCGFFKKVTVTRVSIWSMAITRYSNFVGHLAATAMNTTTTMASKDLAAFVNTPDWIVSLRNELAHGPKIPSYQSMKLAGFFILHWLLKYYWKCWVPDLDDNHQPDVAPMETPNGNALSATILAFVDESLFKFKKTDEMPDERRLINESLIAAKNFRLDALRRMRRMKEEDPASLIPSMMNAMMKSINNEGGSRFLMYPFCLDVLKEVLEILFLPFLNELKNLNLLEQVMIELGRAHINEQTSDHDAQACAHWIKRIIGYIVAQGLFPSKTFLTILKFGLIHPRDGTNIFLPEITKLLRHRLGDAMTDKMLMLGRIWFMEEEAEDLEATQDADIEDASTHSRKRQNNNDAEIYRGPKYWRGVRLGRDVSTQTTPDLLHN